MKADFTPNQISVLVMLADVARNEGGEAMVKRRYYGAAISLCKRGLATGRDNFPYRPTYQITPAGMAAVERIEADKCNS